VLEVRDLIGYSAKLSVERLFARFVNEIWAMLVVDIEVADLAVAGIGQVVE
jgi:hypothetical protein